MNLPLNKMQKPFMINIFGKVNFHKLTLKTNTCTAYKIQSFRIIHSKGRNKNVTSYNDIVLKVLPIAVKQEKM